MATKGTQGYLLSPSLLKQIKEDNRKLNKPLTPATDRRAGVPQHARYLAKITAKAISGSPASAVYEGIQVLQDSSGYFQTVSGGLSWTAAGDLGVIRDLQSASGVQDFDLETNFHRIPLESIVEVFYLGDEDGNVKWYTSGPTCESFWARLTTDSSPYSWERLADDASTTLIQTGSSNATEVNGRLGIPDGSIVRMFPSAANETNYRFEFHGADVTGGSPFDISYTGEHQEAARTGVAWDRTAQGSNRGVKLTVQVGTAFYDAGDMTLYAYMQDMTFDCNGHLVLISEETRVEIEVPEECICYY